MAGEVILLAVVGLAVGSFLGLAVERWDLAESIIWGRSHCDHCGRALSWWEAVPLVGFMVVRGQCLTCRKAIPRRYMVFELLTAVVFVVLGAKTALSGRFVLELVLVAPLLFLAFYDWRHRALPSAPLLTAGVLALALFTLRRVTDDTAVFLSTAGWSLLVGGGFLALLSVVSRGRWMGVGDAWLGAVLGLWLGPVLAGVALVIAFYAGAAVGLTQLLARKIGRDHRLAFGPYLVGGAIVARAFGSPVATFVWRWWLGG